MNIKKLAIIFAGLFLMSCSAFAVTYNPSDENISACVYFFYGNGCPHCSQVEPFINDLKNEFPNLNVEKFEIYSNRENSLLLNNYFDSYKVPDNKRGVPTVFINDKYLVGSSPILENLKNEILQNPYVTCPELNGNEVTGITGHTSPLEKLKNLSILTIISAALVDSINPCAIAVLLILIGGLLASGNKNHAIKSGFAFTFSIYIAYFLFGLGLFSALKISGLSYWFYKIIGFLAILIGLFNIKDYFWYGKGGFVMEIPRKWRPTLKKFLRKITSPLGAFFAGFLVCLFELPCTGGPYLVILGLLAERTTRLQAIPILLLYNLFFVLPLIIITLLIYKGFTTTEKTDKWKERNIKVLHLITGIVMLLLGLIIVFGLV